MPIVVRITGDRELQRGLGRAARYLADLARPTRRAAQAVADTAGRIAPKRTGRLSRSSKARAVGGIGTVSNTIRYAGYVEYGTSKMRAQPYLRPALTITPITAIYEDHAEQAVRLI